MKILFIVLLLFLVLSSGLTALIAHDPGYLLLAYGGYTIETSIWIAIAALILIVAALYLLLWLSGLSIRKGLSAGKWFEGRGSRRSARLTNDGLLAYLGGNWKRSEKLLSKSASDSAVPLINYVFASRANQSEGDITKAVSYLEAAEKISPTKDNILLYSKADLLIKSERYDDALAVLEDWQFTSRSEPRKLSLLKDIYLLKQDWSSLGGIIPALYKHKVMSSDDLLELEKDCVVQQFSVLSESNDKEDAFSIVQNIWERLSKKIKEDDSILLAYSRVLQCLDKSDVAEGCLRAALRKSWSSDLVRVYGLTETEDSGQQLMYAEIWLKKHSGDASLLLALGRIAMRNKLWDKAANYFSQSLTASFSSEASAELLRLSSSLGDLTEIQTHIDQGLLDGFNLPKLPMPEAVAES